MNDLNIRHINIEDIPAISKLYKEIFDRSYLSVHYSVKYLNKYFGSLIRHNKYCYTAVNGNSISGFLIGGLKTGEAVGEFRRQNRMYLYFTAVRNPKFILLYLRKALKKIFGRSLVSDARLRLFIIAVKPEFSGRGIGIQLIKKFEEDIGKDGFNNYGLFVRKNNKDAIRFYNNRGLKREFNDINQYAYIKHL